MRPIRLLLIFTLVVSPMLAQERVRKHVCDMTETDWTALNHAFEKLEGLPADNVNNYITWADIHGFGPPASTGPCKHKSEQLWTWHRAYLYWFEEALRASDPPSTSNVTLPYWDWTQMPSGDRYPIQFEQMAGLLPPAAQCPTIAVCRDTTRVSMPPFDPALMTSIQAIPEWTSYGGTATGAGQLELEPHNTIHGGYIEGLNSTNAQAARDPVFWAHHSNLDRLWSEFQTKARADGREPGPVNKAFPINFLAAAATPRKLSGDYAEIGGWLNYSYQPQIKHCGRGEEAPLAAAAAAPAMKGALLKIALPKAESVVEAAVTGVTPSAGERVLVRFRNITTPTDASYVVRVYLRPAGSNPANRRDADLLTFFTLWRSNHDHADMDQGDTSDVVLDVTDRYRQLTAGNAAAKRVLDVDIVKREEKGFATSRFGEPVRWSSVSIEEVSTPKQTVK
jgi:tyrosinase